MRVIIEITDNEEIKQLMALLRELGIDNYNIIEKRDENSSISYGDRDIDPSELFGIWKDSPRKIDEIREEGWNRS